MLVKRYHAADMQQAMDTIIRELGSDAIVLSNRKIRKKGIKNLFSKRVMEVTVAYDPDKVPGKRPALGGGAVPKGGSGKVQLDLSAAAKQPPAVPLYGATDSGANARQIADLDKRLSSLDTLLTDFISKFSHVKRDVTYDFSPPVEALVTAMLENQVQEDLVISLAKETETILRKRKDTSAREVMEHLILEMLGESDPVQTKKFHQKIILFAGPTGVGKTTSLVKLASRFTLNDKKKVGIINTDTYRIAAQEQLRTYAEILAIPLNVVYQLSELDDALAGMADREIVFIDTAGKRPGDKQHQEDIQKILEIADPGEIMLCVSAPTAFAAVKEIVDNYSYLPQFKLLVTKVDETRHRGMILNLGWYAKRPLTYLTTGQNVPDDIEIVDMVKLVGEILGS